MMVIIMVITRIIEQMLATIPKMKLIIIFVIKTQIYPVYNKIDEPVKYDF